MYTHHNVGPISFFRVGLSVQDLLHRAFNCTWNVVDVPAYDSSGGGAVVRVRSVREESIVKGHEPASPVLQRGCKEDERTRRKRKRKRKRGSGGDESYPPHLRNLGKKGGRERRVLQRAPRR